MTTYADLLDDPRRALENRWTGIFKRDTAIHPLLFGCLVVSTGVSLLVGSPRASVRHSTIRWFLLGALLALAMLDDEDPEAFEA